MEWFDINDKKPKPLSLVRVFAGDIAVTMSVDKDGIFVPFPGMPHVNGQVTHWAYEPYPMKILQYIISETTNKYLCK